MKMLRFASLLVLLTTVMMALFLPGLAMAEDEPPPPVSDSTTPASDNTTPVTDNATPPPTVVSEPTPTPEEPEETPDTITASTEFPRIEAIATGSFVFNVEIQYRGNKDRVFDLNVTAPAGWDAYVSPQYDSTRISSISIESSYTSVTKNLKVSVNPPAWPLPDPGEYKVTFQAVNEDVVGEIDLYAKIIAKYLLTAVPANQVYNTKVKAGRDNIYSIIVTNTGSADIENITFSSDKPDGWEITFTPEKIDALKIVDPKSVDVNIKPPPKTVAGDYMITLRISGKQATADKMDIRVTVETPTIWGWLGVGIIVVVVIGLAVIFMRFGRR
jgi:uncharacterized membrane protein